MAGGAKMVPVGGASAEMARANLEAMAKRSRNMQPVLSVIAQDFKTLIDDSFRGSKSPDGVAWAPNAPSTIKRKKSAKPGIDKGLMRAGVSVNASSKSITIGSAATYSAPVNFGSRRSGSLKNASYSGGVKRPKGTSFSVAVPARPFMPFVAGGVLMKTGQAGALVSKIPAMISQYIKTGRIV